MKSQFKENFNFYTNIFLLCIIFFGGVAYADNNGIWTYAKDIVPGIFGEDEGADPSNSFTFVNQVDLNEDTRYKGVELDARMVNENQANSITSNMIVDGTIGSDDVNDLEIQDRINDICPSGQSIRAVNSDGTVACELDSVLTEADVDTYVSNNGYLTFESDPTVPANIKDGVSWSEVSGIPSDLNDGSISWSEIEDIPTSIDDVISLGMSVPSQVTCSYTAWNRDYEKTLTVPSFGIIDNKFVVRYQELASSYKDYAYGYYDGSSTDLGACLFYYAPDDGDDNIDLTPEELEFYKILVKENKDLIEKGKRDKCLY
ncbi:MAG: hypothetical protein PF569_09040 [Candidatus Woesearchaeota archaeon]|jgi:hypothetical protein|nr:hypothetical protein [Candidatus Woesearchaeota archaeon]